MSKKIGAFFIHGFLGYPSDFGTLPNKIAQLGIDTKLIVLPGHEKDDNICRYSWKDWISYTEKNYKDFRLKYDEVILIGFSMGGTIATYLAGLYSCSKLILISPAFEYINTRQNIKDLSKISKSLIKKKNDRDGSFKEQEKFNELVKKEVNNGHLSHENKHRRVTLKTYKDFYLLTKYCNRNTPLINVPVRIYHGENDEVIPISSSLHAFNRFKSIDKRIEIIAYGRHLLMFSLNANIVVDHILGFVRKSLINHNIAKEDINQIRY